MALNGGTDVMMKTQVPNSLLHEVAAKTGESFEHVSHLGFSPLPENPSDESRVSPREMQGWKRLSQAAKRSA